MQTQIPTERFEIFATGLDHPECCAFDREGNLWAGGEAGQIYRADPAGKVETIANVGGFCCGVALAPDDSAIFVCVSGAGVVRVAKDGTHTVFATHAGGDKIIAPNFLLFDRAGRLYVTDSGNWMKRNGRLLRFDTGGEGIVLAGPVGYANGLALSADEQILFMVESDTDSILRFGIGAEGAVGQPDVYATDVGRLPDGVALDAEGSLYACCYASDEIWRIDETGRRTLLAHDRWGILLGRPTNLAFGGPNFDEIFVANLGRFTITRAKLGVRGRPPTNLL
jgi:gluconolactonase